MEPSVSQYRVLQVHPTRRCNLTCLHCYSSSGPGLREEIAGTQLCTLLDGAVAEGFDTLSVSGGEPLLYSPLAGLLAHAKRLGMLTLLMTNGTVTTRKRMEHLVGVLDLMAVSLDGVPESHNRMRNSPDAFQRMQAGLEVVRDAGIRFGFIFTLTQHNLHELPWVAEFAVQQRARLLQIHPIEEVGRAATELRGENPDEIERTHAFLEVLRIQAAVGESMLVQLDLAHRSALPHSPPGTDPHNLKLADIVSPLVLEDDGVVVPLQYGFPREFAIGALTAGHFADLAAAWKIRTAPGFMRLCASVAQAEAADSNALPFFNWYAHVATKARESDSRPRVASAGVPGIA